MRDHEATFVKRGIPEMSNNKSPIVWVAGWLSASFISLFVTVLFQEIFFPSMPANIPLACVAVVLSLSVGWVIVHWVEGRPPSLKAWLPEAIVRGRERTIAFADKVLVASVSSIVVFFVLHALGFNTDLKFLVVPIGFTAVFLGLSIFG